MDFFKISLVIGCGLATAFPLRYWTRSMIERRTKEPANPKVFVQQAILWWLLAGITGGALIAWRAADTVAAIAQCGYLMAAIALSVVDHQIRKIPNETLLAFILIRVAELVVRHDFTGILYALISLIAGYFIFLLPSFFGRQIGLGDVKYAAVIGFCLGIPGLLQSIAILGLSTGGFLLLLILTKRGNLRTKMAIGPYLSFGLMVSVLFPLFSIIQL